MSMFKWALLASTLSLVACQSVGADPRKHPELDPVELTASAAKAAADKQTMPEDPAQQALIKQVQADFPGCVTRLQKQARSEGIGESTINNVLAKVEFNPRILELDRKQPEFSEIFANYLGKRVTQQRVDRGRELYRQHAALLNRIQSQHGVPGQYLVAFWGMETNFGGYFGKLRILNSLATLACDQRRSDYFSKELMDALRIVDSGDISADRMLGSWAGAMGHTQFMPSVFVKYAVDADKDGHRDLWGSIPDALTSAANFLQGIGWNEGQRWGREVLLPANFPYQEAGLDKPKNLTAWNKLGVRDANGNALPSANIDASLLVPSGHRGPAFLVYDNFKVIMRWNRSEYYALSVGILADQIAGGGPLHTAPPTDVPRLSRAQVMALQTRLAEQGFDSGKPDGIMGPATRNAIRNYQHAKGLIADGFPDRSLFESLKISVN